MSHDPKPHLTTHMVSRPSPSTLRTRHDYRGRIMFPPPSKPERLGWATFYGIFAVGGAVVLIFPPRTIGGQLGDILVTVWGILWVAAIIPAIATFHNRYKIEYPTILLVLAGVAIYAANIWAQVPDTHTRATQALTVTALAIGLSLRWWNRRRLVHRDKQRDARADPGR